MKTIALLFLLTIHLLSLHHPAGAAPYRRTGSVTIPGNDFGVAAIMLVTPCFEWYPDYRSSSTAYYASCYSRYITFRPTMVIGETTVGLVAAPDHNQSSFFSIISQSSARPSPWWYTPTTGAELSAIAATHVPLEFAPPAGSYGPLTRMPGPAIEYVPGLTIPTNGTPAPTLVSSCTLSESVTAARSPGNHIGTLSCEITYYMPGSPVAAGYYSPATSP